MSNLSIVREDREHEATMLRLAGTFDRETAQLVANEISASQEALVFLDFSRVTDLHNLAIPILTLNVEVGRLRLQGVPNHHERVFRCFGVAPAAT